MAARGTCGASLFYLDDYAAVDWRVSRLHVATRRSRPPNRTHRHLVSIDSDAWRVAGIDNLCCDLPLLAYFAPMAIGAGRSTQLVYCPRPVFTAGPLCISKNAPTLFLA